MESGFISRIRKLLEDVDVDNRIYALVQIELIVGSGAPEAAELERLLEESRKDRSPDVAARASRMSARLAKARHAGTLDTHSAAPLGEPARRAEATLPVPEGHPDRERTRAGISRHFTPWLERAAAHVRDLGGGALPQAVSALAAFAWPGGAETLEGATAHDALRGAALAALRDIGTPEAVAALRRVAAGENPDARHRALELLGRVGLPELAPELTQALAGTTEERRAAVRALSSLPVEHAATATPLLLSALEDPEPEVVVEAVKGLGQIADPETAPALARTAQSRDSRVRATVAAALTRIVVPAAEATLRALCRDVDARVRANAVDAFVCFHPDRATMRRFYASLLRDEHHRVRSNALVILWPFNSKVSYATLQTLIGSQVVVERSSGYWASGKLGEEAAVRAMVRRMSTEDDQRAVEQSLVALENIDRKDLMLPVRKLLTAPWPRIRLRACRVLATVGDPGAASDLKKLVATETDPKVLHAALRALARLAPADAVALITGPGDAELRASAVAEGLGDAPGDQALPHLGTLLTHPAPGVRARAIAAAVLAGDLPSIARLEQLHTDSPADAFDALAMIGRHLGPAALREHPVRAAAFAAE